jgi:hypothetical protein
MLGQARPGRAGKCSSFATHRFDAAKFVAKPARPGSPVFRACGEKGSQARGVYDFGFRLLPMAHLRPDDTATQIAQTSSSASRVLAMLTMVSVLVYILPRTAAE